MEPSRRGSAHARRVVRPTPPAPPPAGRRRPPPKRNLNGAGRVRTSVANRQNLPEMSVSVFPVDVLPAEPAIDQHVVLAARSASVREPGTLDAAEDRVEIAVADAEAEMGALELLTIREVEGQRVVDIHRREFPARLLPGHAEQIGE